MPHYHLSPETRKRISEGLKGKHRSEETKAKMRIASQLKREARNRQKATKKHLPQDCPNHINGICKDLNKPCYFVNK